MKKMNTLLSAVLFIVAASALSACSSSEKQPETFDEISAIEDVSLQDDLGASSSGRGR